MKLILKRTLIILMVICSVFPTLFPVKYVFAEETTTVEKSTITIERAGNYVSSFAINFYNNWSSKTYKKSEILTAYNDSASEISNPISEGQTQYVFSNKSFIDFVYKNGLGLQNTQFYPSQNYKSNKYLEEYKTEELEEVYSSKETNNEDTIKAITELVNSGAVIPGDILYTTEHEYLLYVGGIRVLYARAPQTNSDEASAIRYEYLQDYLTQIERKYLKEHEGEEDYEMPKYGVTHVYKMKQELIDDAGVDETTVNLIFNNKGYYDVKTKYSGIPSKSSSSYNGSTHKTFTGWLIKSIWDIAKWLINLMLYVVRMVIVGWVNVIESIIQTSVLKLSGNTNQVSIIDKALGATPTAYSGERVTVESLFYNKLPLTDANFFDYESAGGYPLIDEEGNKTVVYVLRENLANWYVIVRNLSIALTLFVLMYMAIRMAMSTIAKRKADYKQKLKDWAFALAIVILVHFFMYAVIYMNNTFVQIISEIASNSAGAMIGEGVTEASIYDAIRTKAYSFNALDGTAGLILYIMLVYFFIRYFLIYVKRMVAVYVLAMMGSFMGVKYAFDKANGKKTTSLGKWVKDFSFNVLLQSIHCMVYSMLMLVALRMALMSISGIIVAILVLQVMLQADKIVMKVFGVKSGGLLEDASKPESYFTIVAKAGFIGRMFTGPIKMVSNISKGNSKVGKWLKYAKYAEWGDSVDDIEKKINLAEYQKYADKSNRLLNKKLEKIAEALGGALDIHTLSNYAERQRKYRLLGTDISYTTKKNIYESMQKQKEIKKKNFTRKVNTVKNLGKGALDTVAGVAMLSEGFAPAIHRTAKGISELNADRNKTSAKIYRRLNPDAKYSKGMLSDIQIGLDRADEKAEKDLKKVAEKQAALEEDVKHEEKINEAIDKINARREERIKELEEKEKRSGGTKTKQEITQTVDEELIKSFNRTVNRTNKTNISQSKIKRAIDKYMLDNNQTTISAQNDLDGILDVLQDILDENDNNKIKFDLDTRNRLRKEIINLSTEYNAKDAKTMLAEKISMPDVIEVKDKKYSNDAQIQQQLEIISKELKSIHALDEKNAMKNKEHVTVYSKVIKEMGKRIGGSK